MIVFDLDGTLLQTNKTISMYTQEILRKYQEAGLKIVYATGRGNSAETIVPAEIFDGKITMNGSIAKINGEIVYHCVIPCATARPFLLACDKRKLSMTSEIDGVHYTNFVIPGEWADIVSNWELTDFRTHNKDAEKIYTYNLTPEDIVFINELLPSDMYMVMAVDGLAMIMHKDATKANAVSVLAKNWGIKPCEIAAFGDDLNDIDLLEYAGISIAMGNALDDVKSIAAYICDTNDNDGAAKWLSENIKI